MMITRSANAKKWLKRTMIGVFIALIGIAIAVWYIFTEKFNDTSGIKADYKISATELIHDFEKNDSLANKKYAEHIITVNGILSGLETADSTINLKMSDTTNGSYIIFAFQKENQGVLLKNLKEGDRVSVKGSCSGGAFSEILGTEYITFKRCVITK